MTILALDLAQHYGYAVVDRDGNYVTSGHRSLTADARRGQKLWQLHLSIADLVTEYAPDWIAVEKPTSRHYGAARNLFCYAGVAETIAHARQVGYIELSRAECYAATVGKGRSSKPGGVLFARQFKPLLNSEDEADALLVAMAAHKLRDRREAA